VFKIRRTRREFWISLNCKSSGMQLFQPLFVSSVTAAFILSLSGLSAAQVSSESSTTADAMPANREALNSPDDGVSVLDAPDASPARMRRSPQTAVTAQTPENSPESTTEEAELDEIQMSPEMDVPVEPTDRSSAEDLRTPTPTVPSAFSDQPADLLPVLDSPTRASEDEGLNNRPLSEYEQELQRSSEELLQRVPVDNPPTAIDDQGEDGSVLVPEYLNPLPNPLQYPTQVPEVDVVGTQPITLDQAIELARRNNRDLQDALLTLEQSQAALREQRAANLPTLDAFSSLTTQDTDSAVQPTDIFGNPTQQDTVTNTFSAGLEINYDLFTSGRRSSLIRAAEEQVRLQELQIEVISEELRNTVVSAYYDMQQADELVRIDRQTLEEALKSLEDAQALERAGVGTRFSVLQAEVDVANARQDLIQSLSDQQVARRRMVDLLGLAQTVNVSAADPIEVTKVWTLSLEDSILMAFQNRAELEQQLVQRDISEQNRQAELAATRPQVSLFARYELQDLLDQTRVNSDAEVYTIGAQISWRLFDAGASRAAADQQESNIELAENGFANLRNQIRLEVEEAYYQLNASFENIQTAAIAVESATESLRLARLRFQAGVGTQLEVLQAQTDLTDAEVNLLQAKLGYNRALADLERAVSNVPDNVLSDRP
jgi:OMF family outer membrane factor